MMNKQVAVAGLVAIFSSGPAAATLTISDQPTQNITCAAGICTPTATDAILNTSDLETLLGSGDVEVTTTGSGVQAVSIVVAKTLTWSTTNSLMLDAYESVAIRESVSLLDTAGLVVHTNDGGSGGSFSLGRNGRVTFEKLASVLTINGARYTLVNTIKGFARHVAQNPNGNYAFARNHDAGREGTFTSAPIVTAFTGQFEGLGNEISNLSIVDTAPRDNVGLFASLGASGTISDISLTNAGVQDIAGKVAVLVGFNQGSINHSYASGIVAATGAAVVGGLVGLNEGSVGHSHAEVEAHGQSKTVVGGLVGENGSSAVVSDSSSGGTTEGQIAGGLVGSNDGGASISNSRANGIVIGRLHLHKGGTGPSGGLVGSNSGTINSSSATGKVIGGNDGIAGGLVGDNGGTISNSFATGSLDDTRDPDSMGGLAGQNSGTIGQSYATGSITETQSSEADYQIGGLVGYNVIAGSITNSYATGNVAASGYLGYEIGGLVGWNYGSLSTCYASGTVSGAYGGAHTGGLVGENYGTIDACNATGNVTGDADAGGLVDLNDGEIKDCYAIGSVAAQNAGGLVGVNLSTIDSSFAAGAVSTTASSATLGGLISQNPGAITNSYATGAVTGASASTVGGFAGNDSGSISYAYSTGAVAGSTVGGSIGNVIKGSKNTDVYWDTTSSGTATGVGAGSSSGIIGLTTEQLQSGLPDGFSLSIWAEDTSTNNDLPYLIANPPP